MAQPTQRGTGRRPPAPDGYLIYLVKQIELGLRRHFENLVTEHGMTPAGYTALTVLQSRPGTTSSELARRSFVRAQTMAETVNALIGAGLVRRETDPAHRRQLLLFITDAGDAAVSRLQPDVRALEEHLVFDLTGAQRAELVSALRSVRDQLQILGEGTGGA